jgi:hypothetical protein
LASKLTRTTPTYSSNVPGLTIKKEIVLECGVKMEAQAGIELDL